MKVRADILSNARIVLCESCGSEGRIQHITHTYVDFNNGDIVECGWEEPCAYCEGTGGEIIETEPIDLRDLIEMAGPAL